MYRLGHYGVALFVYAPLAFALVAVGRVDAAVVGAAGVVALTPLPDYDQRLPLVSHRGVTHTVGFALLVGGLLGAAGFYVGSTPDERLALGAFSAMVGLLAIGAHLLADVLTPAGVEPFWPLSGRNYSLYVTRADNTLANYLLLALGVATFTVALVGGQNVPV
ncbi:MAG: metal-dependent hydrolase [Halobacteriaceae archaeon]